MKRKLNFRIVENAYDDIDFEELIDDYLNPMMTIEEICKKHDISRKKYYSCKKRIVEETGVSTKPSLLSGRLRNFVNEMHIYKIELSGKYRIVKEIDKKTQYFGDYDSMEIAKEVRELLIAHDWDREYYLNEIKPKYNPTLSLETPVGFEEDFFILSVDELKKKYGLTTHQYSMISTPLKIKLGITRKPSVKA